MQKIQKKQNMILLGRSLLLSIECIACKLSIESIAGTIVSHLDHQM